MIGDAEALTGWGLLPPVATIADVHRGRRKGGLFPGCLEAATPMSDRLNLITPHSDSREVFE
jgi:hypothetical protein